MVNLVHFNINGIDHVVIDQLKIGVADPVLYVSLSSGEKVVHDYHLRIEIKEAKGIGSGKQKIQNSQSGGLQYAISGSISVKASSKSNKLVPKSCP